MMFYLADMGICISTKHKAQCKTPIFFHKTVLCNKMYIYVAHAV